MNLNTDQLFAVELAVNDRKNVMINGKAGTGKTLVLREIYRRLVALGYTVICMAYTGKAASLLPDGMTISRATGIKTGIDLYLPSAFEEKSVPGRKARPPARCAAADAHPKWTADKLAVIIDEASQISSEMAILFYEAAMAKRGIDKNLSQPLWILSADFGQMLPITGNLIFMEGKFEYWSGASTRSTVKLPSILSQIKPQLVQLTQVMRQSDPRYIRALDWLYYGVALHPFLRERIYTPTPPETPRIMYNRHEVAKENLIYVERFARENPNAERRKYSALITNVSDKEVETLLPVIPETIIYCGCPFTITVNVPDPTDPNQLLVANGEKVIVAELSDRYIKVKKSDGRMVELGYVEHIFDRTAASFQQLPGYIGPATTLYKCQGTTLEGPTEFGAWQWKNSGRSARGDLQNQPGALYVMFSRNTQLDDIFIDTSFSKERAEQLLCQSVTVDPRILSYLLEGRTPLWKVDELKSQVVVEFEGATTSEIAGQTYYQLDYLTTLIQTGEEIRHCRRYDADFNLIAAADRSEDNTYQNPHKSWWWDYYQEIATVYFAEYHNS